MEITISDIKDTDGNEVLVSLRLAPGQLLRLPADALHLTVISGRAWATGGSRDFLLRPADKLTTGGLPDAVLVSALGGGSVAIQFAVAAAPLSTVVDRLAHLRVQAV